MSAHPEYPTQPRCFCGRPAQYLLHIAAPRDLKPTTVEDINDPYTFSSLTDDVATLWVCYDYGKGPDSPAYQDHLVDSALRKL